MMGNVGGFRPIFDTSFLIAATALGASLVLGGGTRSGFLADALLQLLAIPLLLITLARWRGYGNAGAEKWSARFALVICGLLVLIPVIQLLPLPPAIWSRLGGRELVGEAYGMLNLELPWMPLSVTPRATWLALLSFIPVIAVFLATLQIGYHGRRALSLLVIGIACFSVFYGMLQVAQGPASPLRLFAFTNNTEAVGQFANRNHYAALLYSALLLMAPWAAAASADMAATSRRKGYPTAVIVAAITSFTIIVMLLSAQAMARSRAGMALAVLAILAALVLPMTIQHTRRGPVTEHGPGTWRVLLFALSLALIFTGQFALDRVMQRFDTDLLTDARVPYARNTIEAALSFMPLGSGIGSFIPVYGFFEKPGDIHRAFANRAHNDILEAWLETGVIGIMLFALFAVWYFGRSVKLFGTKVERGNRLDALLMRASVVVIALLLAHSLADYPLRTGAMAAMFAFCCALMLPPPPAVQDKEEAAVAEREPGAEKAKSKVRRRASSTSRMMSSAEAAEAMKRILAKDAVDPRTPAPPVVPPPGLPAAPSESRYPPAQSSPRSAGWPAQQATDATQPGISDADASNQRGKRWSSETNWPDEWRTKPGPAEHPSTEHPPSEHPKAEHPPSSVTPPKPGKPE